MAFKVFIHGVPDTGYLWTPLIEALGLSASDYFAPTLPGFDGATPSGFASTKEAYRDWVVAVLEGAARDHGPVDLVGHDWGSSLSAMAAERRPDLIRSWTIVNAAPEPTYKWHFTARLWQTPVIGEAFMAIGGPKRFRDALVKAGMPPALADHEAPLIDGHMKRAILKLYRSAKRPADFAPDLSAIADRGLVLWGEDDPYVGLEIARRFADRWALPLATVEGVGHWGLFERPDAFAAPLQAHWSARA